MIQTYPAAIRSVLMITVLVIAGFGVGFASTAAAQSTGQVDVNVSTLPGSGTAEEPYEINNASELQAIQDDRSAHYKLGSDIDASGTAEWNSGQGFEPLHSSQALPFNGVLDGNDHSITDLVINRPALADRVGLFAVVGDGEIRQITIRNATVTGSTNVGAVVGQNDAFGIGGNIHSVTVTETNVTGTTNVGGVVGINNGVVHDSSADGTITSGDNIGGLVGNNSVSGVINESTAESVVSGEQYVGGLVGTTAGRINASAATSGVNGAVAGGLVGLNEDGAVTQSYATGRVRGTKDAGGLVGSNTGLIENTYARGPVNGSDADAIGGLVGRHATSNAVNTSYSTGDVTALDGTTDSTGGLIGVRLAFFGSPVNDAYWNTTTQSDSSGGMELQESAMTGEAAETNMSGLSFGEEWETRSNALPVLAWQSTAPSNTAPTAAFSYSPATPTTGTSVSFSASESTDPDGEITSYAWDFDGDGTTDSSGETVAYTYQNSGEYDVDLTVTDENSATNTTTQTVVVDPADDENSGVSRFDTNNDGQIGFGEVLTAIGAHNNGTQIGGGDVGFQDVLSAIQAHNDGTSV